MTGGAGAATLGRMARQLEPRGPDGERIMVRGDVGLVYRRLRTPGRDPAAAGVGQPIHSADGRYLLICDSDLHHRGVLRHELTGRVGPLPAGANDAELVLAAWQQWGAAGLDRCQGGFALALLDTHTGQLLLARDPYGSKQLYLAADGSGRVAFANDLRAVLAAAVVPRRPDELTVHRYLRAGRHDDTERTFFDRVTRLLPGELAVVAPDGSVRRETYTRFYGELDLLGAARRPYDATARRRFTVALTAATARRLTGAVATVAADDRRGLAEAPAEVTGAHRDLVDFVVTQQEPVASPAPYAQFCAMRRVAAGRAVLLGGPLVGPVPGPGDPGWGSACRRVAGRLRHGAGPAMDQLISAEFAAAHPVPPVATGRPTAAAEVLRHRLAATLRYADRNAARFSLVVRAPLLDPALLRLRWSVAVPVGGEDRTGRWAERAWFARWSDLVAEVFAADSFAARGYVDASAVRAAFDAYRAGRGGTDPAPFWRLFHLELWLRELIDRDPVRLPADSYREFHRRRRPAATDHGVGYLVAAGAGAQDRSDANRPGSSLRPTSVSTS